MITLTVLCLRETATICFRVNISVCVCTLHLYMIQIYVVKIDVVKIEVKFRSFCLSG